MAPRGNTLGRPPRLPNGAGEDTIALLEYLNDVWLAVADGRTSIIARLSALEDKLAAIAAVTPPPDSASGSYTQAEATAALAAIRSILTAAEGETA